MWRLFWKLFSTTTTRSFAHGPLRFQHLVLYGRINVEIDYLLKKGSISSFYENPTCIISKRSVFYLRASLLREIPYLMVLGPRQAGNFPFYDCRLLSLSSSYTLHETPSPNNLRAGNLIPPGSRPGLSLLSPTELRSPIDWPGIDLVKRPNWCLVGRPLIRPCHVSWGRGVNASLSFNILPKEHLDFCPGSPPHADVCTQTLP